MKRPEAFDAVLEGKKIRRKSWVGKENRIIEYLFLIKGKPLQE